MKNKTAILAAFIGLLLGSAGTLAVVNHSIDGWRSLADKWHTTADKWAELARVQSETALACQAKFSVGTVLFEPRPTLPAGITARIPNTPLTLSLNLADQPDGSRTQPTWMIPAQVKPLTNQAGARYRWVDLKDGHTIGEYPVAPLSPEAGAVAAAGAAR